LIQNKSKIDRKGFANYGVRDILNLVPKFRQFANSDLLKSVVEPILGSNTQDKFYILSMLRRLYLAICSGTIDLHNY
jgi:hypothetical protein